MDWHQVIRTLQTRAAEQLREAQQHANEGSLSLGSAGLIAATVSLNLADALREGLRHERTMEGGRDA